MMKKITPKANRIKPKKEEFDDYFGNGRGKVTDERLVLKYIELRNGAKSRGIEFDLSLKRLRQVINTKRCQYTNKPMLFNPDPSTLNASSLNGADYLSIERMDSNIGYTDDNVIAVKAKVNNLKSNLDPSDIIKMARKLEKMGYTASGKRKIKK